MPLTTSNSKFLRTTPACCGDFGFLSEDALCQLHEPCPSLNGAKCAPCEDLQDLKCQMVSTLQRMKERHKQLKMAFNRKHDPISNLPPEIASIIFHSYVFDDKEKPTLVSPTPLLLGSVCTAWRDITWSTPQLWTRLSLAFFFPYVSRNKIEVNAQLAKEWLSRAGQLPLSISIRTDKADFKEAKDRSHFLYVLSDVLQEYHSRWRNVSLHADPKVITHFFLQLRGVSMIKTLDIGLTAWRAVNEPLFPHAFDVAPCRLKLKGMQLRFVNINWDNVTSVELANFRIDECLEVLRRASKLERCSFTEIKPPTSQFHFPTYETIQPRLRLLTLTVNWKWEAPNPLDTFFTCARLPSLVSLTCHLKNKHYISPTIFKFFIDRSSCHLQTLTIMCNLENVELVSVLRAASNLRKLHLEHFSQCYTTSARDLFQHLGDAFRISARDGEACGFLPALESLIFSFRTKDPPGPLWDLLAGICSPINSTGCKQRRPLIHVEVDLQVAGQGSYPEISQFEDLSPDTFSKFVSLAESGIDLQLFENGELLLLTTT